MIGYRCSKRRRRRSIFGLTAICAALLCFMVISRQAKSDIIDCSESHQGGVYQVYVDEPNCDPDVIGSDTELQNLMGGLVFHLNSTLEGIMEDIGVAAPYAINYCEGRQPRGISDFDKDMVETLDSQDVVLEVWSTLESRTVGADSLVYEAIVHYLLIPVWREKYEDPVQPGVQLAKYTSGSVSGSAGHLDLLKGAPELQIFATICIGRNLLLNEQYDAAREFLCAAKCRLEALMQNPSSKEKALIDYVDQLARRVVTEAKNNPDYNSGLKLVEDEKCPCLNGGG